jgi:superfamily II DNA/RNA helicase
LQTLIRLLDGPLARARKVLIFSQFADTVDYLYENLRERPATQKIDGSTSNQEGIIRRFAPRANPPGLRRGEHEIRLLISSDVLSEGLNLQDCDHIINYDLHWNPVRLIQRIGRIDRIGSEHAEVYAFNFLPETGLEKHLGLEDKLTRRIEEIHRVIGGDPQILHPTEQPNDDALYAIYRGGSEALEGYEEVEDLTISEVEGIVRQIQKEKPEYFEYIRSLPDGVRSAKAAESRGYFAFLQAGGYQQLALLDPGGKVVSRDLQEGLRAIRCEETEPARDIPREMNRMISGAKSRFDREVEQREAQREHARSLSLGQRYVLDQVRIIYSGTEDERLKHSIEVLERAFRSQVPLAVERRLNSLRRNHATGEPLVDRLAEIYRYFDLHTLLEAEKAPQVDRTIPRIVSSEALL